MLFSSKMINEVVLLTVFFGLKHIADRMHHRGALISPSFACLCYPFFNTVSLSAFALSSMCPLIFVGRVCRHILNVNLLIPRLGAVANLLLWLFFSGCPDGMIPAFQWRIDSWMIQYDMFGLQLRGIVFILDRIFNLLLRRLPALHDELFLIAASKFFVALWGLIIHILLNDLNNQIWWPSMPLDSVSLVWNPLIFLLIYGPLLSEYHLNM